MRKFLSIGAQFLCSKPRHATSNQTLREVDIYYFQQSAYYRIKSEINFWNSKFMQVLWISKRETQILEEQRVFNIVRV